VLDETMPHATTILQFGAAALSLVASGLAVVQHAWALRNAGPPTGSLRSGTTDRG
jgi:hypothetical protein